MRSAKSDRQAVWAAVFALIASCVAASRMDSFQVADLFCAGHAPFVESNLARSIFSVHNYHGNYPTDRKVQFAFKLGNHGVSAHAAKLDKQEKRLRGSELNGSLNRTAQHW